MTRVFRLSTLLTALLIAGGTPVRAEVDVAELFPAGTEVVIGIKLRSLLDSPLAKQISTETRTSGAQMGAQWLQMTPLAGFDPLKDIDEVLIAATAKDRKAPGLVVIRGKFDVARLGAGGTSYKDVRILAAGGKTPAGGIALLDEATLVLGELPQLHAAIDRMGHGAAIGAELSSQVNALRTRYDVWGTGDAPAGFEPARAQTNGFETVDHFQFGVLASHGIEVSAEFRTRTAQDAEALSRSWKMMEAMFAPKIKGASGATFQYETEGNTLKLSLKLSEAEVLKALAAQRKTPANTQPTVVGESAERRPAPKSAPTGGTAVFTLPGRK